MSSNKSENKMQLYLHFGIYKAGSSYLQYVCAANKTFLKEKGYFFPDSAEDHKMIAGKISKGNAGNLSDDIKLDRLDKVEKQISKWVKQASEEKLDKILISSEAMVHQLVSKDSVELFLKACDRKGIIKVHAMGFFRELVDHAISTYKHRAKSGRFPDFEYWLKNHYETPEVLKQLSIVYKEERNIAWTFREFKKDSQYMLKVFFKDWLNIQMPELPDKPQVNESLTLSEILLINKLKPFYPYVIDYFVERLKELPANKKYKSVELEDMYQAIAESVLCNIDQEILIGEINLTVISRKLENTAKPDDRDLFNKDLYGYISLTKVQIEALFKSVAYFNSTKGRLIVLRRKILYFSKKLMLVKQIGYHR